MNKTIKNVAKVCLFPAVYLNRKVRETNWYNYNNDLIDIDNYPTNKWYRESNHLARNYDLIVIGGLTGLYDFNFTGTNIKFFNWSLPSLGFLYTFKTLQNYFSILKKGGYVLLSLCPISGIVNGNDKEVDDRFYGVLDRSLIDDIKNVQRRRSYPLLYHPLKSLRCLIKDEPSKHGTRPVRCCHSMSEFEADASKRLKEWKKKYDIQAMKGKHSDQMMQRLSMSIDRLRAIVEFCIERDLKLIFIMPPIHTALYSKISFEFRRNYIESLVAPFNANGITCLNYMNDRRFIDDKYFQNSYIMSEEGAKLFTKQIINALGLQK